MSSIADDVRKAGDHRSTALEIMEAGDSALTKIRAHQKKMGLPINASVTALGQHLVDSGATNYSGGFAQLESLCLQGELP